MKQGHVRAPQETGCDESESLGGQGAFTGPKFAIPCLHLSYDGKDGLITRDIEVWGLSLPCVFTAQSMSVESWLFHVRGKNGQLIHKAHSPANVRLAFANQALFSTITSTPAFQGLIEIQKHPKTFGDNLLNSQDVKLHLAPLDPLGTFLPGDGLGPEGGLEDREEAVSFQHSNLHLLFLFFFVSSLPFFFF